MTSGMKMKASAPPKTLQWQNRFPGLTFEDQPDISSSKITRLPVTQDHKEEATIDHNGSLPAMRDKDTHLSLLHIN